VKPTINFVWSLIAGFVVGIIVNLWSGTAWLGAGIGLAVMAIINALFWQAEVRQCRRSLEEWDSDYEQRARDQVEEVERERAMRRTGER
jgi:membrane protein implicated in regulation of membrane protease activity